MATCKNCARTPNSGSDDFIDCWCGFGLTTSDNSVSSWITKSGNLEAVSMQLPPVLYNVESEIILLYTRIITQHSYDDDKDKDKINRRSR